VRRIFSCVSVFVVLAVGASVLSFSPVLAQSDDDLVCNGLLATIVGTDGDDVLQGTHLDDVIVGLGGNDVINGASGSDTICGGDGDDVIDGQSQADVIFGDDGNDTIYGRDGADQIFGGDGDDNIEGHSQNDVINGGSGDDTIDGGSGDDVIDGGAGVDDIDGLWGNDSCDDAETAVGCETVTNNGEPTDVAPTTTTTVDPADPATPITPTTTTTVAPTTTTTVPTVPVIDVDLVVPEPYVTSDGVSEVEVGWPVIAGAGITGVEVFRDGVSIGTTATGSLTAPLSEAASVTYTAQTIGVDGTRSALSEPVIFTGATSGECVAVALNDGTTAITWVNAPDGDVTVLDQVNGSYRPLEWIPRTDTGIAYFVDSVTAQAGQPGADYRVVVVGTDGALSSQACDGREFSDSELDRLNNIEFPITDDGMIGGVSSSAAPQRVSLSRDSNDVATSGPRPDAEGVLAPVCSGSSIRLSFEPGNLDREPVVALLENVPPNTDVLVDIELRGGNFVTNVNASIILEDGTFVSRENTRAASLGNVNTVRERFGSLLFTSRDEIEDYRISISFTRFLRGGTVGSVVVDNFRFVAADGTETNPCALTELLECEAAGGNYYNDSGQDLVLEDGFVIEKDGCYQHDTCTNSPFSGIIDQVARWACRNDAALDIALNLAVATLAVGTVIYIAPAISAGAVAGGAGIGLLTTPFVCDQTDNGFIRPSLDLDPTCVATEVALGAVFAPLGAGTSTLGRAVAVGCAEGATSTAAYGYTNEGADVTANNVAIGTALGCITGGAVSSGVGLVQSIRLPRPVGVAPTGVPVEIGTRSVLTNAPGYSSIGVLPNFSQGSGFSGAFDLGSGRFVALPSGDATFIDGVVPANRVAQFTGHDVASDALSSVGGSARSEHVGFVVLNQGEFVEVRFRSGTLNRQHTGTNDAPADAVQPILDAVAAAVGLPARAGVG